MKKSNLVEVYRQSMRADDKQKIQNLLDAYNEDGYSLVQSLKINQKEEFSLILFFEK